MSKSHGDGGKGSSRRNEDVSKINENWDRIFGKKKEQTKVEHEHDDNEHDREDDELTCDICGGPMYRQSHWNYAVCDDCGARQELENDDYL